MSAPAWMPLYVADYLADTGHLSMAEHGAYMLLIMHYWQREGLPTDDRSLASICHAVAMADWLDVREKVMGLFQFEGGRWHHKRIDAERSKTKTISKLRSLAGKAGADARYGKSHTFAMATAKQTHGDPPSSSSLRSEEDNKTPTKTRARAKKATRIPADFQPDLDEAERLGLSRHAAEQEAASFTDYWRSKPVNATKLDWEATWRNWVRKSLKDHNKGDTHGQRRPQPGAQESPTRIAARIARGG